MHQVGLVNVGDNGVPNAVVTGAIPFYMFLIHKQSRTCSRTCSLPTHLVELHPRLAINHGEEDWARSSAYIAMRN